MKKSRIIPHQIHGDSENLTNTLNNLVINRVLKNWWPDNFYTWDWHYTSQQYFEERIKPQIDAKELGQLEGFVYSLDI